MRIGNKEFDLKNHTYVMGILNVTPDSFSDGGKYNSVATCLKRAEEMIKEGCDIIDVGGESTRPGYELIDDDEEIKRVVPIIKAIKANFDIPISIDTYKSAVAKAAIGAGADLVNDIYGLKYDEKMANIISEANIPCCLMHNRELVKYDIITEMKTDLLESIAIAKRAGIATSNIILDPGVGFAKTHEQNLEVIAKLKEFSSLKHPLLLGTSRKSVIGLTLNVGSNERVEGTIVTTVLAVLHNYGFVRVHDIKENKRAIEMMEAIKKSGEQHG